MADFKWRVGADVPSDPWESGMFDKLAVLDAIVAHGIYDEGTDWWVEYLSDAPAQVHAGSFGSAFALAYSHYADMTPANGRIVSISSTGHVDAHWYDIKKV